MLLVCPICHCKVMDFIAAADPDHAHANYRARLSQAQFTKNRYPQEMWQAHVVRADSTTCALDQELPWFTRETHCSACSRLVVAVCV